MAIVDFGYRAKPDAFDTPPRSLDVQQRRHGYQVSASAAATRSRVPRLIISLLTMITGAALAFVVGKLVTPGGIAAMFAVPIGAYLMLAGGYWSASLFRRPTELIVDKRQRAFHLIRPGLGGAERARQTIRFEEVAHIELVDHVPSFDMSVHAMHWSLARIDVTWQRDRTLPMITGDIAEIEPLLKQLRREVGMA